MFGVAAGLAARKGHEEDDGPGIHRHVSTRHQRHTAGGLHTKKTVLTDTREIRAKDGSRALRDGQSTGCHGLCMCMEGLLFV